VGIREEDGSPVVAGADALLGPGELLLVRTEDRVARRAFLAAVAGRLEVHEGRLVVLDRVLPEEAVAVRARAHLFERFPRVEALARIGRRRTAEPGLVLVDAVAVCASADARARRWELLAALTARGVAVVAGTSREPRDAGDLTWTTLTLPAEGASRPTTEEATL
jgi:putative drug exporter of the RND superfamily